MIQALKNNIALIVAAIALMMAAVFGTMAAPAMSYAATDSVQEGVCKGAKDLKLDNGNVNGGNCTAVANGSTAGLDALIAKIINIFSIVVGIVAVIMIIFGGFRYVTSGGDSNNVGAAKNTILYAIVGLIIVALAQIIVKFVLGSAATI